MKLEILELVIRLAILVMAGIVIPAFKKWFDTRTENEQMEKIHGWVYAAVGAAEQIHKKVEKDDPDGTKRKKYAHDIVMKLCIDHGIGITDKELDMLIEAAVNTINSVCTAESGKNGGRSEDGEKEDNNP